MLHAQSISIMVSTRRRCNARCKPCISRTTPDSPIDNYAATNSSQCNSIVGLKELALRKGLGYAARLGATHAILTGKADPLQERPEYLANLVRICREFVPLVDVHSSRFYIKTSKSCF
jgi:hypothetical protein